MMNGNVPGTRCLVADDVRGSRELLRRWLADCDVEVVVEQDGQSAWERIKREPFDFVITDIEMPRLSGLGLLRLIRSCRDPRLNSLPVIAITSLLDHKAGEVVTQLGGTTVLVKPLEKSSTIAVVEQVLTGGNVAKVYDSHDSLTRGNGNIPVSPKLRRLMNDTESEFP